MSPLGCGSVLNAPGTNSGVPSKNVHGFQPLLANPNMFFVPARPTTSTPRASIRSGAISPSIWYGSTTFTGVPGRSSPNACRNW